MSQTDNQTSKKRFYRWWWIALAFAGVLIGAVMCSGNTQNLKVSLTANGLEIVNVGTAPIRILDVIVNDRDDCSTFRGHNPPFSKEYLHKAWVANGEFMYMGERDGKLYEIGTNRILSTEPRTLQTGDAWNWVSYCFSKYVSATVTTDDGTVKYSFR